MSAQEPDRLESWKEIGAYLQRDIRTLGRWEKEEGLPIHRHTHKSRASVYAFKSEIDAWREARKVLPEPPPPTPLWKTLFGTPRSWAFGVTMALSLVMVGNGLRPQRAEAQASPASRMVWSPPGGDVRAVSRDGRFSAFIDWEQFGNLYLHDFQTGAARQLTNTGTDGKPGTEIEEFADATAISRDGMKVAYAWYRSDHARAEVRISELTESGIPAFRTLYDDPEATWVSPHDWTPDGKSVAVEISRRDSTRVIGIVSDRAVLRPLKSIGWRNSNRMVFSPDGRYLAFDLPPNDNTENRDVYLLAVDGGRESAVVAHPSHDALLGWAPDGRLVFASDRTGSMAIWAQRVAEGRAEGSAELVKRDVGSSWESLGLTADGTLFSLSGDAETAFRVQTAAIDLETGKLTETPQDVLSQVVGSNRTPVWSPDGKYLAYQSRRSSLGMRRFVFTVRSLDGGSVRELTPSPNFEKIDRFEWAPDGKSFVVTGYGPKGPGVFQVDAQSGKTRVLVEDANLFGALAQGGKKLYFIRQGFATEGKGFYRTLIEKDLASGTERELGRAPNVTNVWMSPDGKWITAAFPPASNAQPKEVLAFPTAGGEPRSLFKAEDALAVNVMAWMPDSRSVRMRRRVSQDTVELWDVPVGAGTPVKLATMPRTQMAGAFRLHPDGKRVVMEVQSPRKPAEVWALENFLPQLPSK